MWTNETKLIYSVERWPHNVTTTITAISRNASYTNRMYPMMTMNEKWRNEEKDDNGQYEMWNKKMKVDRRVKFTWAAVCLLARPSAATEDRSRQRRRYVKKKKEVTADPLTPDTFLLTDSVELCAAAAATASLFFANSIFASCSPLFHSILFLFMFVQCLADSWIDNHNSMQRSSQKEKQILLTSIAKFACERIQLRRLLRDAINPKSSTDRRTELSQAWSTFNRTHRNSFGCLRSPARR